MNPHLQNLLVRTPVLELVFPQIEQVYSVLVNCFREGKRLYLCGNGGSAADCEHWAGELLKGFYHKRPLSPEERRGLPDNLANQLQGAFPVIPLTGFMGLSTAFANDVQPELIFAQLVWGLGNPGDVLLGISTSGNAKNVAAAMHTARAKGLICIGLTGRSGGELKNLVDHCIQVPADETYLIQELHLPIYHALCLALEKDFFAS